MDAPKGRERPWVERRTAPPEPPRPRYEPPGSLTNKQNGVEAAAVVLDEREDGRVPPKAPPEPQIGRPLRRFCRESFA